MENNPPRPPRDASPITLAIETSNPAGPSGATGVCLGRIDDSGQVSVLASRALAPESRHDDALMPAIAAACEEAAIAPRQIERIAVSIGPGGFTSVRIGVTTAQVIAEATDADCIAVPTAEALALRVTPDAPRQVHVLLAWKRETVWRHTFDGDPLRPLGDGELVDLRRASAGGAQTIVCDPALAERLREAVGAGVRFIAPTFDAEAVLEASLGRAPVDPAALLPLYPREPEAVTQWKILRGA